MTYKGAKREAGTEQGREPQAKSNPSFSLFPNRGGGEVAHMDHEYLFGNEASLLLCSITALSPEKCGFSAFWAPGFRARRHASEGPQCRSGLETWDKKRDI